MGSRRCAFRSPLPLDLGWTLVLAEAEKLPDECVFSESLPNHLTLSHDRIKMFLCHHKACWANRCYDKASCDSPSSDASPSRFAMATQSNEPRHPNAAAAANEPIVLPNDAPLQWSGYTVLDYTHTAQGLWGRIDHRRGTYDDMCTEILRLVSLSGAAAQWKMEVCDHANKFFKMTFLSGTKVRTLSTVRIVDEAAVLSVLQVRFPGCTLFMVSPPNLRTMGPGNGNGNGPTAPGSRDGDDSGVQ